MEEVSLLVDAVKQLDELFLSVIVVSNNYLCSGCLQSFSASICVPILQLENSKVTACFATFGKETSLK